MPTTESPEQLPAFNGCGSPVPCSSRGSSAPVSRRQPFPLPLCQATQASRAQSHVGNSSPMLTPAGWMRDCRGLLD